MAKVYSVLLSKGGVAKTVSTASICYELGRRGYKVLAVDCDPQANLTAALGVEPNNLDYQQTLTSIMTDTISFKDTDVRSRIIKTNFGVDLLPTTNSMRGIDKTLESREMRKEYVLKEIIDEVKDDYDYVFEDSGPTFSLLTINLLVSCDRALAPLDLSEPATRGLLDLMQSMKRVRKYYNPDLELDGVFYTRVKRDTVHAKETMVALRIALEKSNVHVYNAFIPDSIKVFEAISNKQPIGYYDPACHVSIAYRELVKEFIERG